MSSTRGIDRSHFTSYSGSIDPDHYSEQKKREIYTDRPGPFHSIGEGRFTQIDRSVRIDRSIPCRGKNPKSIFLVLYDYIRIDSHLIWTDQAWFQFFKLDFSGMKVNILKYSQIFEFLKIGIWISKNRTRLFKNVPSTTTSSTPLNLNF